MKPASARRTRPQGAGRDAAPGPRRRTISAPARPTSSVRSAPACGTAAGLVLPRCNTAAMALHLAEISQAVEPGCHAVLLLDQAGWHLSDKLAIPDNITLMPLPAKSPELNPTENIWQFMRDNWLSNRIFRSYEDILDPLLPRLEQAGRPALDHHVHRLARLGASVLISESWY